MSTLRFMAIILIFGAVTLGWWVLGGVTRVRTDSQDRTLSAEMESLWGPRVLAQAAPYWAPTEAARTAPEAAAPDASDIAARFEHHHRHKGLLNYITFTVDFKAAYTFAPAGPKGPAEGLFIFPLPSGVNRYDRLSVTIDGQDHPVGPAEVAAGRIAAALGRQERHVVEVAYQTGGQEVWLYAPGEAPNAQRSGDHWVFTTSAAPVRVEDFTLTATTGFAEIDYPRGTRSPNTPAAPAPGGGRTVQWTYKDKALTNQAMGLVMPKRANAGPLISRMSLFAPVSLLFFFTVLFTVVVLRKVPLHPMHYLFISAGFFAFHILLAYLADLGVETMSIHPAFWISAAVSVFLVVSYMRLVAGLRFAACIVGLAQLVYLIGFSYAFMWEGKTGLTITIGAIATLFVLMQATGRVKWGEVFARRPDLPPPPQAPIPPR